MKNQQPRINLASLLATACLALVPSSFAVDPPPDGGYPGFNTAEGSAALELLTTGLENTAVGSEALQLNTTGSGNTGLGAFALIGNSTGNDNIAIGAGALAFNNNGSLNTAVGHAAMNGPSVSGSRNVALGQLAGVNLSSGSDDIDIGNQGVAGESGIVRLGTEGTQTAVFIAGIRTSGLAVASGVGITADGQLGVRASSARFKEAIKPMDKASEAILSLRPVSFRYKKELDPAATPQFGLVAEEVEKVDPNLVAHDASGKPYTVRYEEVNAMLLNEFLKEHRKVEQQDRKVQELEATVAQLRASAAQERELQATVAKLQSALKEQAGQIQKVSDQLRTQAAAPRVVANN